MAKKKKLEHQIIRTSDGVPSEFSRNFELHVAPKLSEEKADLIRTSFNFEYVNSLNKEQLSNLVRQLSIMANQRIGTYKRTKYYQATLEGWNKPVPAAYRILEEQKGDIEKFDLSEISSMELSTLRKQASTLSHFLASESSYASGQERIMQVRYKNMTDQLKKLLSKEDKKEFNRVWKDEIMSDEFQRKFWEIYNKVEERVGGKGSWYETDKFMSEITRVLTIEPLYGYSIDDIVLYIEKRVNSLYEEHENETNLPDNTFTRSLKTGSNR